jgi:hypothetical protein
MPEPAAFAPMVPSLADPGTAEALMSRPLGEGEDRLPDCVLVSRIVGPRPGIGSPRPFDLVRAEFPAVGFAVRVEELLRFLDGS